MKKILLVEDDEQVMLNLRDFMELEGFSIATAENGMAGITQMDRDLPDLVICDLQMPIMDGFEFLKEIKVNPKFKDVPIIIFSAKVEEKDKTKAIELGANAFLSKPLRMNIIMSTINDMI